MDELRRAAAKCSDMSDAASVTGQLSIDAAGTISGPYEGDGEAHYFAKCLRRSTNPIAIRADVPLTTIVSVAPDAQALSQAKAQRAEASKSDSGCGAVGGFAALLIVGAALGGTRKRRR